MHFFFITLDTRNCEIKDHKSTLTSKVANFILILFHIKVVNLIFKDKFLPIIYIDRYNSCWVYWMDSLSECNEPSSGMIKNKL